jgi:hypothetical protein
MTRQYYRCPVRAALRKERDKKRWAPMAALYKSGMTLEQIGQQYGCTREYIRQCLAKLGITGRDGGKSKCAAERRAAFEAKRNAKSLAKFGCNWNQYLELRHMSWPTRAFCAQRSNANKRGISWEMNLWQWWSIWQQSGKWSQRGRGQGYVMCRNGDQGGYSVNNVFIAPARVNSSEQDRKKNGLPIGVRKNKRYAGYTAFRSINGVKHRRGSFPTPELAYAAYLSFEEPAQ